VASARHRQPKSPDAKTSQGERKVSSSAECGVRSAESKDKGGRPTAYRKHFSTLAYKYALLGATDRQMAEFFGVTEQTLNNWKLRQKGFFESLKRGKAEADSVIAHSLFHRAKGYSHESVKIMQHEGSSYEHKFVEHYPPDSTAAIFWLKNRQPELWRDKAVTEVTGRNGGPVEVAELTVSDLKRLAQERGLLPSAEGGVRSAESTKAK
jgi:hypothetical protein